MASGYGYEGGQSRCYSFWQQFLGCYISIKDTKNKRVCIEEMEDYLECLHHTKEIRRWKEIQRKAANKTTSIIEQTSLTK
ncbi:hypothetical protein PCANB_002902 [Pneumocystis canis]|nr:hypothetical protein PCK1_002839 [Pneumocystis canis]KAG5438413.1 hypothetical protein PCANB_002902 [Pneumocystis canis]